MESIIHILRKNSGFDTQATQPKGFEPDKVRAFAKENGVYVKFRGNLALFNYLPTVVFDNAWNDFNLQCRGIIINLKEQKIIAHPFDKFFNLNERPETMIDNLPLDLPYEISVKEDGSLGTAFYDEDGAISFATRGAFESDQAVKAIQIAKKYYWDALGKIDLSRYTLIFEVIYPQNRIVVNYGDREDIILTGIRDLTTNETMSYRETVEFAKEYGLAHIQLNELTFEDLLSMVNEESSEIREGWVVRFANGLYVKIKTEQYREIHRLIAGLTKKNIVLKYQTSDAEQWRNYLINIPEEFRQEVEEIAAEYQKRYDALLDDIQRKYNSIPSFDVQKDFALYAQANFDRSFHSFFYSIRAGKDITKAMHKRVGEEFLKEADTSPLHDITEL